MTVDKKAIVFPTNTGDKRIATNKVIDDIEGGSFIKMMNKAKHILDPNKALLVKDFYYYQSILVNPGGVSHLLNYISKEVNDNFPTRCLPNGLAFTPPNYDIEITNDSGYWLGVDVYSNNQGVNITSWNSSSFGYNFEPWETKGFSYTQGDTFKFQSNGRAALWRKEGDENWVCTKDLYENPGTVNIYVSGDGITSPHGAEGDIYYGDVTLNTNGGTGPYKISITTDFGE